MADTNTAQNGATEKKKRNFGPKTPVQTSVSQILEWLEHGETRAEIAGRLGLNLGQINALFASSPKLKGKKTKKDLTKSFVLVDDTTDDGEATNSNGTGAAISQEAMSSGTVNTPAQTQVGASWD